LREQLQAERAAHSEARRLLAAALERIPAIEAPTDAPQPATGGTEGEEVRPATEGARYTPTEEREREFMRIEARESRRFWRNVHITIGLVLWVLSILGAGFAPLIAASSPLAFGLLSSPFWNVAYALFLFPSAFGYYFGYYLMSPYRDQTLSKVAFSASITGGAAALVLVIGGVLQYETVSLVLLIGWVLPIVGVLLWVWVWRTFWFVELKSLQTLASVVISIAALGLIIWGVYGVYGFTDRQWGVVWRAMTLIAPTALVVFLVTTLFVMFAMFLGLARSEERRRRRDNDTSHSVATTSTSIRGWTSQQQVLLGLVGTVITALLAFFGVLVQVFGGGGGF
jgi:hypothetical protein